MFAGIVETVREKTPLVHNITNYVTVNDCANMLLACGGSPIMADALGEVEEITGICSALVINIGTLNERTVEAMILAGKKANALSRPVILDPVGAGASTLRTRTVFRLLAEIQFTVIRGNISEIKTVYAGSGSTKGVDAHAADTVGAENLEDTIAFAKELSDRTGAVIAITGAIDIVASKNKAYVIRNGHPMMSRITGTGCMLTSVIGAYCGAENATLEAVAAAVCAMGLSGELAARKTEALGGGTGSFRRELIDAMSHMSGAMMQEGIQIESR